MKHKRILEATNNGCYFSDCGCGASLGVYFNRTKAKEAYEAHVEGREPEGKLKPVFLYGERAKGMSSD